MEPQFLSRGRKFERFDSTFVKIDTDEGVTGWGEVCPWGSSYLAAFPGGVREALAEIAPQLIGHDPRRPEVLTRYMDSILTGHVYAKAGIDYAIWDIIGKSTGLPIYELFGGKEANPVPLSIPIHIDTPDAMARTLEHWRGRGCRRFAIKVGQGVQKDIALIRRFAALKREHEIFTYDANGGWSPWEAITIMNAVSDLETTFEQPCVSYDECVAVRRQTRQPISLDECLGDLRDYVRAITEKSCEVVNVKLARVGGLTRARAIRDLCLAYNIQMLIMCMAGTVINDTVVAHFAQTIPANRLIGTWSCQDLVTVDAAPGRGARNIDGNMAPPDLPGLGVEPDLEILGKPLAVFS